MIKFQFFDFSTPSTVCVSSSRLSDHLHQVRKSCHVQQQTDWLFLVFFDVAWRDFRTISGNRVYVWYHIHDCRYYNRLVLHTNFCSHSSAFYIWSSFSWVSRGVGWESWDDVSFRNFFSDVSNMSQTWWKKPWSRSQMSGSWETFSGLREMQGDI